MYLCIMNYLKNKGIDSIVGMIGGGQLGRMFIQEAINLNVEVHVLDPDTEAPCKHIAHSFTQGSLNDYETVLNFGSDKDVLTVEIENINIDALEELEKRGKSVVPQPFALRTIKDKGIQKEFYKKHEIPTASFQLISSKSELSPELLPCVQKLRSGGYDGKGVQILRNEADLERAFDAPSVLEELIDFEKELSVIVARNASGQIKSYPAVECEFNPEANLVELLFSPAEISAALESEAQKLAISVIEKLGMIGILAVEMFLTKDGRLLVNEIAPRPHNSGHHTVECNVTSQFAQHLRAILNLPLGSTEMTLVGAMINLLGEKGYDGPAHYEGIDRFLEKRGIHPHLYGKRHTKPFRKMGHVTISGNDIREVKSLAHQVLNGIRVISK
jgi:5-(carboxyamino)imidazole ribonucleotide synthase